MTEPIRAFLIGGPYDGKFVHVEPCQYEVRFPILHDVVPLVHVLDEDASPVMPKLSYDEYREVRVRQYIGPNTIYEHAGRT